MERIVIEVTKVTAKKWRTSTQQQKRKLAAVFQKALEEKDATHAQEPKLGYARPSEEVLQAHFNRVQKTLPEYRAFLDEIGRKAEANGLTEDILQQLLKDA